MNVLIAAGHAIAAGVLQSLAFFWDSLFGLVFGFVISAVAQVVLTPAMMQRYLGPTVRGVANGTGLGIIASACSYGSTAAARGLYAGGADVRAVFAFLISSTNMNVAILILFWSLLGWKFAFAEFFGGIIIILVVSLGFTLLFRKGELERLAREHRANSAESRSIVTECPICGMDGEAEFAAEVDGRTYWACGRKHQSDLLSPARGPATPGWSALGRISTWREIAQTAAGDAQMLKGELLIGYLIAGFAAALIPAAWFAHALHAIGAVRYAGYLLLLLAGLAIAVVTFVCSMGNVPIARFLAGAGIPLGANVAFIYGDLLIPPLVAIYRKSFPPRITWTFLALFVLGAVAAGAAMGAAIGNLFGGVTMGSMALNDRITLASNLAAIAALVLLALAAAARPAAREHGAGR
jgi:uncharacterized membrane protein YraQ (UPF0718 family)